jgi:hypothetical protein
MTDESTFPFRGPAPDRDTVVLDQATTVSLAAWQAALPPEWLPPAFRAPDGRRIVVRRRDVFALAEHAHTPVGAMHTHVAAAAWGSRSGREVSRRLWAFADVEAVAAKLATITDILAADGAAAGFTALRGEQRIAHVGPAFGTKYLYFAGTDESRPDRSRSSWTRTPAWPFSGSQEPRAPTCRSAQPTTPATCVSCTDGRRTGATASPTSSSARSSTSARPPGLRSASSPACPTPEPPGRPSQGSSASPGRRTADVRRPGAPRGPAPHWTVEAYETRQPAVLSCVAPR